jgi:ketosteroid isomerase-like protein
MSRPALVLLAAALAAAVPPGAARAAETAPDLAAEVEKGVRAYNAREIAYYESALLPDAVLVADDGAIFAGKERVTKHFARVFGMTPPRQIAVSDVVSGGKGDVAWARFKWTLTGPETSRAGVATTIFVRGPGGGWQIASIHNTRSGHGAPAGAAAPHRH